MAKKKTAKKSASTHHHHHKITVIVPDAIANLPWEVLERIGASIGTAATNYNIHEVQIVAASNIVCTMPVAPAGGIGGGGWDKIY